MRKMGLFLLCLALANMAGAEPKLPQVDLQSLIDKPLPPLTKSNHQGTQILLLERSPHVPLSFLASPWVGLAGAEIDVAMHASKRSSSLINPQLLSLETRQLLPIKTLKGRSISGHSFSPDGRWLLLNVDAAKAVELWIVATDSAEARQVKGVWLNDIFINAVDWSQDSQSFFASTRPQHETIEVSERDAPTIEEAKGSKVPSRTFAHLLRTQEDEALFERFAKTQILQIRTHDLRIQKIGSPGLYTEIKPSPDGKRLLVERMQGPFSYAVPASLFARSVEVWELTQKKQSVKVFTRPLAEDVPPEGERKGPRSITWQPDYPARLLWAEVLDDGDPRKKVEHRDRLMRWDFPFEGAATEILRIRDRFAGTQYFEKKDEILLREVDHDTDMSNVHVVDISQSPVKMHSILSYSLKDAYKNPGRVITRADRQGTIRIAQEDTRIFLAGPGRNPEGERPFLDSLDLLSLTKKREFEADPKLPYIEEFAFFRNGDIHQPILLRESPVSPPNLWQLDPVNGNRKVLTEFVDNVPAMTEADKKALVYQRKDGVTLSGTLYLPKQRLEGQKLPAIVWAYPEEYRSIDVAGQVRVSDKRYSRPGSTGIPWMVTQGYAVLDNAAMPVVGDKETGNNSFAEQIVANAEAAVDALDKLGIIDRQRVAIGGHSYGAFMTANVLAHSPLFCAGIARSGAYNRSLTPFGFQAERRTFWEAKNFYMDVSPFYNAEKISTPLLLVHGKRDNNPGTLPMQTERMFHAIRGIGGKARLVLLPYESHGYRSRENIQLLHKESLNWLNRWCGPKTQITAKGS